MEKIKTVCTGTITPDFMEKIRECCDVTMGGYALTGLNTMPEDELIALLQGAEIAIIEYESVTRKVIENCPSLRLIVCPRGKPVNIDCEAAAERGIPVVNTPAPLPTCPPAIRAWLTPTLFIISIKSRWSTSTTKKC